MVSVTCSRLRSLGFPLHRKLHKQTTRVCFKLRMKCHVTFPPPWEANHTFVQSICAVLGLHGMWFTPHWLLNIRKGLLKPVGSTLASRLKLLRRAGELEGRTAPYTWDVGTEEAMWTAEVSSTGRTSPPPYSTQNPTDANGQHSLFPTQHQVEPPRA